MVSISKKPHYVIDPVRMGHADNTRKDKLALFEETQRVAKAGIARRYRTRAEAERGLERVTAMGLDWKVEEAYAMSL